MKERAGPSGGEPPCYTLINFPSDAEQPSEMQLRNDLEKGDIKVKTEALKKVIFLILNGEKLPGLLMTIIRFLLPLQDHMIKKLLLIFWEIVPKTSADGKLLHEMILVCDAYRKDLQHPNEFIRGSTLRFLCKLREPELLEPLMPAIRACLEHRHAYVRRNAILAIFTIYKNFEFLIPDAPEVVATVLEVEQDMATRRNSFLMLLQVDQKRALDYLSSCLDQIGNFGDILQLVIVELIYKVCHNSPSERTRFIRCIYNLLNSNSSAVRYEAAGTLVTLSTAPSAIKAAATCYIEIIVKESDNNVKLIVLERLAGLRETSTNDRVLEDLVMDILRILAAPDLEVRRKTLNLVLELLTSRTVTEAVVYLRKEVGRTHNSVEHDDTGKYRQLLVRTLHQCCVKFPDVAPSIIPVLTEFLSDTNELAASDVLLFMREAIQRFPHLTTIIIERLLEVFPQMKSSKVLRSAIWILCEFASSKEDIENVLTQIKACLAELPLTESELRKAAGNESEESKDKTDSKPQDKSGASARLVTSDGTYATQSAFSMTQTKKKEDDIPSLRRFLIEGDFFIGAALSSSLAKMVRRLSVLNGSVAPAVKHKITAEAMYIMASVLRFGTSGIPAKAITSDDIDRIQLCIRVLGENNGKVNSIYTEDCRKALALMLAEQAEFEATHSKTKKKKDVVVQPDDPIMFEQLVSKNDMINGEDVFETSLSQAVGLNPKKDDTDFSSSKLSKVTQLTGFSDPVYAEAYINVNQFDIVLDVLLVNQTTDTLQNCTLELATRGELKLVERPQPIILGPSDFSNIRASIKVTSTENALIFGNIVYDVGGATSDRNVIMMNEIRIDIMDYILPASCTDVEFRQMWAEFEWENKVGVSTGIMDLHEYLQYLLKSTNMQCLTPEKALMGNCGFMAATLYAKSIFGEDALANLSIEKPVDTPNASVTGHIRIRAKSQAMALSLGDKITLSQKKTITQSALAISAAARAAATSAASSVAGDE
ncbi:Coatomer subunit beta [Orchesella cincta]|uniref:Coatomer subunit beta n=1 Tax=Orchesella cincta TaxID=48709 RepID=A0A1D2NKS7_ORCCI|nr:Coatomer subunit beta [Orchesella cincta]